MTKARSSLSKLIKLAKHHKMTPEESRKQAISFAYGNLAVESNITREQVEEMWDKIHEYHSPIEDTPK